MFRIFLTVFLFILCDQANAKTFRYEFDVVSSDIYFAGLYQFPYDPTGTGTGDIADTSIGTEELAAFTADNHSLRSIIGQTGSVVFEIKGDGSGRGDFACISGFLCPVLQMRYVYGYNPESSHSFSIYDGWEWHFFTNTSGQRVLFFNDDGRFYDIVEWNAGFYFWENPRATFELTDMIITEVSAAPAPVPLPATALLLGLGLVSFGVNARRRAA